jgi:hypothetical protein
MALALDAVSNFPTSSGLGSWNWAHVCAGSDRILVVGVHTRDGDAADLGVAGITYNAVALTKIRENEDVVIPSIKMHTELWYLLAPAVGSNSIVVTLDFNANDLCGSGAISLVGAHQTNPIDGHTGDQSANTNHTAASAILTASANAWLIDVLLGGDPGTHTVGANQTAFATNTNVGPFGDFCGMSYEGPASGATTMDWSWVGGNKYSHSVVAIAPSGGPPPLPKMGRRIYILP